MARFDSAYVPLNGWLPALRKVEQRLAIEPCLAACIREPHDPSWAVHARHNIIRTRTPMERISAAPVIAPRRDTGSLRGAPMFKLAVGRLPGNGSLPTSSHLALGGHAGCAHPVAQGMRHD